MQHAQITSNVLKIIAEKSGAANLALLTQIVRHKQSDAKTLESVLENSNGNEDILLKIVSHKNVTGTVLAKALEKTQRSDVRKGCNR